MRIKVEGLPVDVDDRALRIIFSEYGSVEGIEIARNHPHGKGLPIAFVSMPNTVEAELAINFLRGVGFHGRHLEVWESR
jgi:RNA recognition motif-containing protein